MTDNRTTGLLCKLLEERGLSCQSNCLHASWHVGSKLYDAVDNLDGTLTVDNLSPEQAVAATLGSEPPYDELLRCLENDWNISASWDGLRKFWCIELTEEGVRLRDAELGSEINGDTSDGYHTFNELYHHRAVLFSVIVANYRDIAWKSKLHHDGTMYDGMFIVGIDTPWGQASYHYDIDPYWDMFDCEERELAPEWDGHTPDEAIERIGKLATLGGELNSRAERTCEMKPVWGTNALQCSECCSYVSTWDAECDIGKINYCPNCRARVVSE